MPFVSPVNLGPQRTSALITPALSGLWLVLSGMRPDLEEKVK